MGRQRYAGSSWIEEDVTTGPSRAFYEITAAVLTTITTTTFRLYYSGKGRHGNFRYRWLHRGTVTAVLYCTCIDLRMVVV